MSSPPPGPTQSPEPSPPPSAFDAHARGYDLQLEPIRAFKDALHLLLQGAFANLPADAHVLVAGAGTGAEVRHLAPRFPTWRFTLVDPSAGMLDVARAHAEADGFAARCTFVVGRVSDLPRDVHHAAISVLVSHFLVDAEQRTAFFRDLADRLGPGGLLFTADLAADLQIPSYGPLMHLWLTLYVTPDRRETYRSMFGRGVAAHTPAEVEAMLVRAGFSPPTPCFQAALIRGWVTSRA